MKQSRQLGDAALNHHKRVLQSVEVQVLRDGPVIDWDGEAPSTKTQQKQDRKGDTVGKPWARVPGMDPRLSHRVSFWMAEDVGAQGEEPGRIGAGKVKGRQTPPSGLQG